MNDANNSEKEHNLALAASLAQLAEDPDFIDLRRIAGIEIDLRYASTNNFMRRNLYGVFNRAFLRKSAANQLCKAREALGIAHDGYKFSILDATRPRSVQHRLWAYVAGTPHERYVAKPVPGSIHNFGFAVDLTILDEEGAELNMGTDYDTFDDLSQPVLERYHRRNGNLSDAHLKNRMLLRNAMESAGFFQHPLEWWHFDALEQEIARTYSIIE